MVAGVGLEGGAGVGDEDGVVVVDAAGVPDDGAGGGDFELIGELGGAGAGVGEFPGEARGGFVESERVDEVFGAKVGEAEGHGVAELNRRRGGAPSPAGIFIARSGHRAGGAE